MSYILDALKKSDKQRKKDDVPDLQTIQEFDSRTRSPKRSYWPYLLAAVLLLNAVLFVMWLGPWRSNKIQITEELTPPTPPNAPIEAAKQPATTVKPPPASPVASSTPKGTSPPIIRPATRQSSSKLETVAKFRPPASAQTMPNNRPEAHRPIPKKNAVKPPLPKRQIVPSPPPEVQSEMTEEELAQQNELTEQIETLTEEQKDLNPEFVPPDIDYRQPQARPDTRFEPPQEVTSLPPSDSMEPQVAPDRSSPSQVMDMMQLPASVRKDIPEIHISAHVYSKKPKSRLVSINGRVLREGNTMPPGLKLEEITTDGVIFSYAGYRFYIGVF